MSTSKIYVGNLPPNVREREIEDVFYKFGKIIEIDLKDKRGPPFAFIEFEDPRDASDAVDDRNGYPMDGYRLRVEFPRGNGGFSGRGRGRGGGGGGSWGDRGGDDFVPRGRGSFSGGGGGARGGRSEYRVTVADLPPSGSWQDLKDHMREAGDVTFADVYRDGTGTVEFQRRDDMEYAMKHLDGSKFKSHEGETAYIRVYQSEGGRGKPRYSSRSKSRSRSPPARRRGSPDYNRGRRSQSR